MASRRFSWQHLSSTFLCRHYPRRPPGDRVGLLTSYSPSSPSPSSSPCSPSSPSLALSPSPVAAGTSGKNGKHWRRECCFPSRFLFCRLWRSSSGSGTPGNGSSNIKQGLELGAQQAGSRGSRLFIPSAVFFTCVMFATLQARQLYTSDKQDAPKTLDKDADPVYVKDWKMACIRKLPLRLFSRCWGVLTALELPVWARRVVYTSWAKAFNANLDEAALPIEEYPTLQDFFTRSLREGVRPIDSRPNCLVSPVDGIVLNCGEVVGGGSMVEQVKGVSYSLRALLGAEPPSDSEGSSDEEDAMGETDGDIEQGRGPRPWWLLRVWRRQQRVKPIVQQESKGAKKLYYCVLYLAPGDYHRIHSPSDWQVQHRRHFAGHLFPVNERSVRSTRDLYVLNERVVLEGEWLQGYMALVAIGATNVGSIAVSIDPELVTNRPRLKIRPHECVSVREYGDGGRGVSVRRGQEIAFFNLGSTVVLVFEAPARTSTTGSPVLAATPPSQNLSMYSIAGAGRPTTTASNPCSDGGITPVKGAGGGGFSFTVNRGDVVRMGQAIGRCGGEVSFASERVCFVLGMIRPCDCLISDESITVCLQYFSNH
ncbi:hypothetical protein CBR_g40206 [Chara braunii]|uniref:Phosphatidylserine decarboxylase proenzyme 1, mitochondrial n=1 Tax=Chara braunii TaxID=69332 RepID=A0A388LTA5_CHABU|nr:hypothetical protein CBR_g40206 [Chara braunii]|eukprot:GBG85568.1 hypothetical protein CBR_g40206 [Chara braunii]